jgi:hypothetical protein
LFTLRDERQAVAGRTVRPVSQFADDPLRGITEMKKTRAITRPLAVAALCAAVAVPTIASARPTGIDLRPAARVRILAPENGAQVGIGGRGWIVDLKVDYRVPLEQTGAGLQLTGPGVHASAPPFPGTFSPGADDLLPNLIVLISTAAAGSCQNLANLFNVTGVSDIGIDTVQIWDNWIIGAPNFGVGTPSTAYVAVAADIDGNGVLDDAPGVVPDADGNGVCDFRDLRAFGVVSNVAQARFFINP